MTQVFSVPAATVASLFAASALTTLLPLGIVIVLGMRKKLSVMPFFVGSALLIGGLSAGLFEETARLLGARVFCRGRLEWRDAVSFGLGHGLCEVVLLVGISYLNSAVMAVLLNVGAVGLLEGIAPGMTEVITGQFASLTPAMLAVGVGERIPAMVFHIFASVMVFSGVRRRQIAWYLLAVLLHTLLNGTAALLAWYGNVWISEGFLWAFGVLLFILLLRFRKKYDGPAV